MNNEPCDIVIEPTNYQKAVPQTPRLKLNSKKQTGNDGATPRDLDMNKMNWLVLERILIIASVFILNGYAAVGAEGNALKIINWNVLYGFNHKNSINEGGR